MQKPVTIEIAEGIYGTWYHHLRESDKYVSLCGDRVMVTGTPLCDWGYVTKHIGERWCSRCAELGHDAIESAKRNARRNVKKGA